MIFPGLTIMSPFGFNLLATEGATSPIRTR